jgi:hypothetical protein
MLTVRAAGPEVRAGVRLAQAEATPPREEVPLAKPA